MSTNDPGARDAHAPASPQNAAASAAPHTAYPAMGSMPDPAVIARLANEFFSALPNALGVNGISGMAEAPATPPMQASPSPDVPGPLSAPSSGLPSDLLQALRVPSQDPATASLASPSGPSFYFLESVRFAPAEDFGTSTGAPTLPALPDDARSPDVNLPAVPDHPVDTTGLPSQSGAKIPEAGPSESSFYFLNAEVAKAPHLVPAALPSNEQFTFPGLPALQSFPGNSGVPQAPPTEADLRALPSSLVGASAALSMIPEFSGQTPALPYFVVPEKADARPVSPVVGDKLQEFSPAMVPELGLTPGIFDPRSIRRDFPILQEQVHGRELVWLDNGATTQKPNAVIDRLSSFYRHENSNVHRAAHTLAARSTDAYEGAREKVRRFLNASSTREIAFVRGTTEGINLLAKSWGQRNVEKDDEIVVTWLEHHANIVPWQQLCEAKGARLRVAPVDDTGQIKLDEYEKLLNPRTRIVALSHVSNALGTITPARDMIEMAHRRGARVLLDGAQSVAHMREDMQALGCDFFVFSGHKVFAPTGIGVVYAKGDLFDTTPPWQGGGNMIVDVTFEKTTYNVAPARFEAGTGSIADAVGLGAALDYLSQVGIDNVTRYEHELLGYATAGLSTVPGLHIIGTAREKAGVLSFVLDGHTTEEVGKALDEEGIAVRAGHHCAQPILRRFGVETTVRATLAMYNTCEDVDALVAALLRLQGSRRGVTR